MKRLRLHFVNCRRVIWYSNHACIPQRCGSNESGWPLLITATPRSATVYTRSLLSNFGMSIADDWSPHVRDARVSWIHAVADPNNYGPPYTRTNLTFTHVLHQMRDPLQGITSMCTENVQYMKQFLERHFNFTIPIDANANHKPQIVLEWWVAWHSFLSDLKIPTYQIETVQAHDIFRMAGLDHLYNENETQAPIQIPIAEVTDRPFRGKNSLPLIHPLLPRLGNLHISLDIAILRLILIA